MTPKQRKALAALLIEPTQKKAAEAAGISENTMRNYLADPEFQMEYQDQLSGIVKSAADQARRLLSPAMDCLLEVMQDKSQRADVRVQASRAALEYGPKVVNMADYDRRISELEAEIKNIE